VAPVLLCPECGTKHPLDNVAGISAFPCSGCGRTLKVPEQARELSAVRQPDAGSSAPVPAAPPPPPAAVPPASVAGADVHATQVFSAPVAPMAAPAATAAAVAPPLGPPQGIPALDYAAAPRVAVEPTAKPPSLVPPAWVRFLLWIVAVPVAFLVVFGLAKAIGLLTTNEITDVALAEGWGRFWPIVRLLPFVALATALFVTGGVYGIARLRQQRRGKGGSAARPRKPPADQPSRTVV
jgi:hypothetical protein